MRERRVVIDLHAARDRALTPAAVARRRFTTARATSGLTPAAFAHLLTEALGWPVSSDAVTSWECTAAVPPGDVMCAAEAIAGNAPPVVESAHQPLRLVDSYGEVQAELARVVDEAETSLSITGSRSRDPNYLALVEGVVAKRPALIHTRVLYGPPRHSATKQHLLRLIDLHRAPDTLRLGILPDLLRDGERFIATNERTTVLVVPSQWSLHNFDTAVVLDDPEVAARYTAHVQQAWLASEPLTSRSDVESLEVVR